MTDVEEMVQAFEQEFQTPQQVLIYGASLGGIVTAQLLEQADIPNVVGALPICGAVGGSRIWDGGVDLRLIYDAVCTAVPGAAIPGGAQGLPFLPTQVSTKRHGIGCQRLHVHSSTLQL